MISDARSAGSKRTPGPAAPDLPALIASISRGDVLAFAALFDETSGDVCAELAATMPDFERHHEILAASYVEVWWLAGCHEVPEIDVTAWITGIVRRRIAEAARATTKTGQPVRPLAPRPSYAELEIAALLRRPVGDLPRA